MAASWPIASTMKKNILFYFSIAVIIVSMIFIQSCQSIPKGAVAVKPFDINRYLGKWYEIARLDFKFEKNLNNTTAEYSLKPNGTIKVINRGYNYVSKEWKQSVGKAKFASSNNEARLKVSFFGPFYAAYNVIALDPDYRYAMVAGKNLEYLWILSREKTIPEEIKNDYLDQAKKIGFVISDLVWVEHDQ